MTRARDSALLRQLHREWRECALCLETFRLSLHHVIKHPRDDVRGNLIMLCGDGVQGCHGRVEAHDPVVSRLLGEHIRDERPDVVEHVVARLGEEAAREWLLRQTGVIML